MAVRGPQVMAGYWQRPEATARVMTADGFFRTGDIGLLADDGQLHLVYRKRDTIFVSGFSIYPSEVKDVVTQMTGVAECAAVALHDGHAGEAVKLVVVKADPASTPPNEADVRAHCEAHPTGCKPRGLWNFAPTCRRRRAASSCAGRCARMGSLSLALALSLSLSLRPSH